MTTPCPECAHEWNPEAAASTDHASVTDAVDNVLADGDAVTVTTTVKVKGASQPLKAGTKARSIRLNPDKGTGPEDHCIDCKIDGFGAMSLKPSVVEKTQGSCPPPRSIARTSLTLTAPGRAADRGHLRSRVALRRL